MALQVNHDLHAETGIIVSNFYCRIQPTLKMDGSCILVEMHFFLNKQAYTEGKRTLIISRITEGMVDPELSMLVNAHNIAKEYLVDMGISVLNIQTVDL